MKNPKYISKADIILIVGLLLAGAVVLLYYNTQKETGLKVQVSVSGEMRETFSLARNTEYAVDTEYGHNLVVIRDGAVYVAEADCADKICVNHKPISNTGETIICLPHQLVVEVK